LPTSTFSIDLRWNSLTGHVPSFLSKLKKRTLGCRSTTSPASLSQLPNLDGLLLDRNKLTGDIPASFADFRQQNFYLYLSHNQLTGNIPAGLGHAIFTFVDVSTNRLEGLKVMTDEVWGWLNLSKYKQVGRVDIFLNFVYDFSMIEIVAEIENGSAQFHHLCMISSINCTFNFLYFI
ncbi:hypothetical protein MIMGU_mgv1a022329mg, partial [Erythranthe guttata]